MSRPRAFVPAPSAETQVVLDHAAVAAAAAAAVPGCPELPFRACAHVSCQNVAGLSEHSLKTYVCMGCGEARFCGKACQKKANAHHKKDCRKR